MSEIPEQIYDVPPEEFDKLVEILKNSDKVIIRNLKVFWEEHELVHCTADGEWPRHCQSVEFQSVFLYRGTGIFLEEREGVKNVFRTGIGDIHTHEDNAPIYWKPLTSLKDEYERQHESENA